jgi:hypothetical protein
MSEKEKAINALQLFNEKAEELLSSTFTKKILEEGTEVNLHWSQKTGEERTKFERKGPNIEEIKAFLIDYRFFIQNNERSSFRNLKELYSSDLLKAKFESHFDSARDALNYFLDSSSVPIEYNDKNLTPREVMDTFIYGGFAHANEDKEKLFKEWQSIPPFFPLIENEFVSSLIKVLDKINYVKNLNIKALKELETI